MRLPAASLIAVAAAVASAAGCGGQAAAPAPTVLGGDLVLLRPGGDRTLAIGEGPQRVLPAGQPTSDGRRLYTARVEGRTTVVSAVDVRSGRGIAELDGATLATRRTLAGGHRVSAVMAAGQRLYAQDGAVMALDARSGQVLGRVGPPAPPAALAAVVR
jgi:hypothetical protein